MHSRSTADCTCWNSVSSAVAAAARRPCGRIMPTRLSSSRSSTPISVAAISTSVASSALQRRRSTIFSSRSVSRLHAGAQLAEAQHAERVADLAQQLDLRGRAPAAGPAPRRTKMSRTSLTLERSSRIAAATVCMSLTLGRGEVLALLLDALIHRQQLREAERGAHRGDARAGGLGAADVIEQVVEQLDRRALRSSAPRPARRGGGSRGRRGRAAASPTAPPSQAVLAAAPR